MKISRDNNFSSGGFFSGAQCLRLDLDLGRLEGGSSGAPYYNQNHRIVAQHYGRPDGNTMPVCDITVTMGGRFDVSWGGGTNTTRLSNWLDPSGTGATVTNTTNVANLPNSIPPTANVIGYYTVNGGTTQYSITNDTYQQLYVPRNSNGIINFYITSATFPFYTWNYDNITSPNLQFGASYTASPYGYGSITKNIYLTANSGCGTTLRTYTFYIVSIGGFGKIAVSPNPTRDALNVTITKETEAGIVNRKETKQNSKFDKTTFSLSPINTKQVLKKWTFNEVKTMNYNLYIKGLATGVYILTIERNGEIATTKVIIL